MDFLTINNINYYWSEYFVLIMLAVLSIPFFMLISEKFHDIIPAIFTAFVILPSYFWYMLIQTAIPINLEKLVLRQISFSG